jgi:K+-transporting ATPase ATPase B chain
MTIMELSQTRKRMPVATLTDPKILGPAIFQSFRKLDPRLMARNPVMFAVEVTAALTTLLFLRDLVTGAGGYGFSFQINLWLWFTVLFANLAEAVAKAAARRRRRRCANPRPRRWPSCSPVKARNRRGWFRALR